MTWSKPFKYPFDTRRTIQDSRDSPPFKVVVQLETRRDETALVNDQLVTFSDPDWLQKVAKKQDASHPYRRVVSSARPKTSSGSSIKGVYGSYTQKGFHHSNFMYLPPSFPSSTDSSLRELALQRLKSKIQTHSGAYNAMVPAAELKDLRGMIKSMAELSIDFIKTLQEIKRTKGKSARQYASKAWLTYSFGIAPTISEVNRTINAIQDFLEGNDHNAVLTGKAEKDWFSGQRSALIETGPAGANLHYDTHVYHQLSYKWTGGFHFPVDAANNYTAVEHFGLSAGGLLPVFWELTPYSWVFDYFTNVGQFLEDTFTGTPGTSIYLTCSRLYRVNGSQRTRYVVTPEALPAYAAMREQITPESFWDHLDIERTVYSSLPMTSLRIKTVDEIGKNSINKLLNLLSILGT